MAPRNVLVLFFFWLLAAAFCVTYVAVTTGPMPTGLSVSSRQDDLQRLRDRPLRSWGPYLPRRVSNGKVPETTVANALPLGPEQPTVKSFEQPKQRTLVAGAERKVPYSERNRTAQVERRIPNGKVPVTTVAKALPLGPEQPTVKSFEQPKQRTLVAGAERNVPYSSERNRAARVDSPEATESALLGAEDARLEPPFKRSAAKAGQSKPTVKLSGTKKKVVAEQAPRKSRFARRRGGRGLGLFALSSDFGRPQGY